MSANREDLGSYRPRRLLESTHLATAQPRTGQYVNSCIMRSCTDLSDHSPVISILTDLICSGFPVLILRNVKISRRTKVGLCGLMSLGLLASGCSIARIVLIESLAKDDITWGTVDVLIWAV